MMPRVEQLLDKVEDLLTASTAATENPSEPLRLAGGERAGISPFGSGVNFNSRQTP